MSIESMVIALHHSKAVGSTKLVLIGIANHDGDGGSYPTIATLTKYAGVSERSVQYAISQLEALGEIRRYFQAGGSRALADNRRPNLYEVTLGCPPMCDRSTQHRILTPDTVPFEVVSFGGEVDCTPGGEVDCTPGVKWVAPKPSGESSLNRPVVRTGVRIARPVALVSAKQLRYLRHMADVIKARNPLLGSDWAAQILDEVESLTSSEATSRIDQWMGFYREAGEALVMAEVVT